MKAVKSTLKIGITTILFASMLIAIGYVGAKEEATSKTNITMTSPVDLTGSWHQVSDDGTPVNMTALISADHIKIMMYSSVVSGVYWDGTFDTTRNAHEIVSIANEADLSQNDTKTFTYENDKLSYDFTMLGKSYVVRLSRGE